jgi:hypothetical protein
VAFPDDPLEHRTQFAFGADVTADPGTWEWTDATPSLLEQTISITRGRQAQAGAVTPGSISVVLDNPDGDFTPELATGAHYPHVVPGVPMRESLRGGTTFIELPGEGARISTPDGAGLGITGDVDLRVDVTLTEWRRPGRHIPLMNKGTAEGTDQSWELGVHEGGAPYVVWRESATSVVTVACEQTVVVPPSGRLALRAAVDVDNGAGGFTVYFWTAPTLAGPWAALGEGQTYDLASALVTSTAPVQAGHVEYPAQVGALPPVGRLHGLEVRDGIDGTVVAQVTAADVAEDAATFTGAGGRTWTVTAPAAATRWVPRITAQVTEWAPTWPYGDLSSEDTGDPGEAQVAVRASGPLQRLGTGQPALQSTLRRRIPAAPASDRLLAYWPCEDGAASTQAASGLPGGTPARLTGVQWAADDSLPGSAALPSTGAGAVLSGAVPAPSGAPDGWRLECVYRVDTAPASASEVINVRLSNSLFSGIRVALVGSDFTVTFAFADATTPDASSTLPAPNSVGTWNRLVLYARQVTATTMMVHFGVITIGGTVYGVDSPTNAGTVGRVTGVYATYGAAIEGLRIGHLAVFATAETSIFDGADTGFDGELAAERMIRLAGEEGVPLLVCGDTTTTAPMGPQGMDTLLDLLQECADTDGGPLGEQRDRLALRYRTRTSLYNQTPALSLNARARSEIANPFSPVSSDEALRNRITATRSGGSSATVEDPVSIARSGVRPDQVSGKPQRDTQLPDMASWALHLATAPGMRYPQLTMDLAIAPQLVDAWLGTDTGDLAAVSDLPPQHPADTVQALVQGYVEAYSAVSWTATTNCTPGQPWQVTDTFSDGDDAPLADSDGSELAAGIDADDIELSVTVTDGPLWSTDDGDYPVDIRIGGGEVATITACTGTSTPQTMTATRGVNGVTRSWPAGATVQLVAPIIAAM